MRGFWGESPTAFSCPCGDRLSRHGKSSPAFCEKQYASCQPRVPLTSNKHCAFGSMARIMDTPGNCQLLPLINNIEPIFAATYPRMFPLIPNASRSILSALLYHTGCSEAKNLPTKLSMHRRWHFIIPPFFLSNIRVRSRVGVFPGLPLPPSTRFPTKSPCRERRSTRSRSAREAGWSHTPLLARRRDISLQILS
jgi:hypothetical protein